MNIKDKLSALKAKAVPKPAARHKVLVQTKVVHVPISSAHENLVHRQAGVTRISPRDIDDSPELRQAPQSAKWAQMTGEELREKPRPVTKAPAEAVFEPPLPATVESAIKLAQEAGIVYATLFMARMGIRFPDAVVLIDMLEKMGVCGPAEGLSIFGHSYRRMWGLKPGVPE
jgi:hypothetical protein